MAGIFKAYGIRGSYPDELDEVTARKIGATFTASLKTQR
jgi:phosphomannomutase